jgi:hypothetical protein
MKRATAFITPGSIVDMLIQPIDNSIFLAATSETAKVENKQNDKTLSGKKAKTDKSKIIPEHATTLMD